jgi:cytochrome oxidase Cu insertion factor (SCO1/SenC/PrrC family)
MSRRPDVWPLAALGALLAVTTGWWALALWPLPSEAPTWLVRARWVCFNATETGLPERSGWILLIGQPLGMVALLMAGWGDATRLALRHLTSTAPGRLLATAITLVIAGGLGAVGARVVTAGAPEAVLPVAGDTPETYPRLDRTFPDMAGLVDQHGQPFSLDRLGGRPALLTFAFAHCETVCPLVVRSAVAARGELADQRDFAVVALTLDPWRDTPSRLPALAEQWALAPGDLVLSGSVEDVEDVLTAWGVARERDDATGNVNHPALVFLVEPDGRVAYASTGATGQLVALARRLEH